MGPCDKGRKLRARPLQPYLLPAVSGGGRNTLGERRCLLLRRLLWCCSVRLSARRVNSIVQQGLVEPGRVRWTSCGDHLRLLGYGGTRTARGGDAGHEGFTPEARGMAAALPYADELVAGGTERKRVEPTSLLQESQSPQGAAIAL